MVGPPGGEFPEGLQSRRDRMTRRRFEATHDIPHHHIPHRRTNQLFIN
jgi:hypothetical protein